MITVVVDSKTKKRRLHYQILKTINEREGAALKGDYTGLSSGAEYTSPSHPYTYDLDIFGNNSLFQRINRTCTLNGEKLLVKRLEISDLQLPHILKRQEAISELASLQDFRQQFLAIGRESDEMTTDIPRLYLWLNSENSKLNRPIITALRFLIPVVTLTLAGFAISGVISYLYFVIAILFNLGFLQLFNHQINKIHAVVSHKYNLLKKYARLLKHTNSHTFNSDVLCKLSNDSKDADRSIDSLVRTMSFFDQRLNDLARIILNGIFLSDLHCITALDSWKQTYRDEMIHWLENIFAIDELNSFANYTFNNPDYSYPTFSESIVFEAEGLGHPLIANQTCVENDFNPSQIERIIVLTGANMSGKSTFLRAMGINLVLAYAGAPVYATKLVCSRLMLYTSMRVTDSLAQDTSYFYAELKRLSAIVENLRGGAKMLILLDEILKGTNSDDKLHGSVGLMEELLRYDCLCIIATHDLALGDLADKSTGEISNYCFESELESDQLTFDYKIKKGIAKNKNATFLMRKEGLIK